MRRRVLAVAVLLAVPVLSVPTASAGPAPAPARAPELCAADASRGAVPAGFPIAACVDGTGMTVRNDRDRPVVLTGSGDVGARVMVRSQNDARSDVVRRTSPGVLVLLPGEVARWPLGSGPAVLTVAPLPVPAAPEIAQVVDAALLGDRPTDGAQALLDSAGALVVDVASALRTRAACAEGRSFLGTAACDVTAAAAIGWAAAGRLDRRTAAEVLPRLLDPAAWASWPLADAGWPAGAETALHQQAAAGPASAPPLSPPSSPPAAAAGGDTGAPARTSPPARTTPAPAPWPAPAPKPAPAPAPAPKPAPAPPPVPVPPPPAQAEPPSWQEIHERNMARLRELAAAWEKAVEQARQQERDRDRDDDRDDDRGGGRDRGRGDR